MRISPFALLVLALLAPAGSSAGPAASGPVVAAPPVIRLPSTATISTRRMTSFDPTRHGFRFANTFANNAVPEFDIRTDGLCGGMVYAALDYFNTPGAVIPTQNHEPTDGTTLRSYIYDRQNNSVGDNLDKWIELTVNPFGTRNEEFWRWGLETTPGSRIAELRQMIDAGRPVPMGLHTCNEGCKGDHQVLAIGYDLGGYRGDLGPTLRQFKIFVYDPNFPGRIMTLVAFPEARQYRYLENRNSRWRTYFIDRKYRPRTPPSIARIENELIVTLDTGGDDLRGGNDNLHIDVVLRDGRNLVFENVNQLRRWINNSSHSVALPLPAGVDVTQIRALRLRTTFGGGIGGDNWNLDYLGIRMATAGGPFFEVSGAPLFRFTGDQKTREFALP